MRLITCLCLLTGPAFAQRYDSGSTGVLGDFVAPSDETTILQVPPDGVFHYRSFTIAPRGIVEFRNNLENTPVYILAVDTIRLDGGLSLNGQPGTPVQGHDVLVGVGGRPGPGGGFGGSAMIIDGRTANTWGLGPGGGVLGSPQSTVGGGASAIRPPLGSPACNNNPFGPPGLAAWYLFYAGSGGGGGNFQDPAVPLGGGGGAGQITLGAQRIEVNHWVHAFAAPGPPGASFGGGGTLRLVAGEIEVGPNGTLDVGSLPAGADCFTGPLPGPGFVRMEAFSIGDRALTFADSVGGVPGPAVPWRVGQRPALRVISVDGQAVAAQPPERHPHLFPGVTVSPNVEVEVVVEANYVPLETVVQVDFNFNHGQRTSVVTTPLAGALERSTARATIQVPFGAILGDVQAWIPSFPLPRP